MGKITHKVRCEQWTSIIKGKRSIASTLPQWFSYYSCMIIRALIIYTLLYLLLNRLRIVHLKICRLIVIYKPHIDIIYFMKSNFLNL